MERPISVSAKMPHVTLPFLRTIPYRAYRPFSPSCRDRVKGRLKKLLSLSLFLWLLFPASAGAQVITASLQGEVRDQSGAVVPGAGVDVRNTATGAEVHVTTGPDGFFLAPSLPPGPYQVTIKAKGFKTLVSNTIVLEVDQRAQEHFALQVGAITQTVSVAAAAPLLARTTSDVGQVVDTNQITNLPLNARETYQFALLSPGVHGSVGLEFNQLALEVNGGLPGTSEILIDGIHSAPPLTNPIAGYTVFPPVDATEEFKMETSNYSAQFGDAGSGIINLIYKSGTNQLHGDAWEFLTNSALYANSFFNNSSNIPEPEFQRSQFGFTLGGPIVIPKIYHGHDKTFFFVDFEGLRQGSASSTTATVPTAAMRSGDFSSLETAAGKPVTIYNPTTTVPSGTGYVRSVFAGNVIPTADINPVSAKIANYYPLPTVPGSVNNFVASGKAIENINNYDIKINENVSEQNRFFVRFSQHYLTNLPAVYFPSAIELAENNQNQTNTGTNIAVDYTHIFSPTFLTEARYGFSRMLVDETSLSEGFNPTQLGFPSYIAQNANALSFPLIKATDYMNLGTPGSTPAIIAANEHTASVNNTWIVNTHTLNFGFQLEVPQLNTLQDNEEDGSYCFAVSLTQGPNPLAASSTAGNGFATFLLGIGSGAYELDYKDVSTTSRSYALYLQDDWRVRSKLTLNLGLRWDLTTPRTERYNRMDYFDPTAVSAIASEVANAPGASDCPACAHLEGGLEFVGVNGASRSQFPTEWTNFGPRVGLAYQVAKNTVIRGGYGIFYYGGGIEGAAGTVGTDGFSAITDYVGSENGLTPTDYISNPFPTGFVQPTGNTEGLATAIGSTITDPYYNSKIPYVEEWNFDIQQQLPGSLLVSASYVGSHGVQLPEGGEGETWDQIPPAALALGTALKQSVPNPFYGLIATGSLSSPTVPLSDLEAPFPQFTPLEVDYPIGSDSVFNSFQLKVERRFTSGLSLLAAYTDEKMLDDYGFISNEGISVDHQNLYDLDADYSVDQNDVSQDLSVAAVYQLPFGQGHRFGSGWGRLTDAFLGGWQTNGILTLQTGNPIYLTATNTSDSGNPTERPNYNPSAAGCALSPALSGSAVSRIGEWFNTACFTQPAPFTFGNVGRTLPNVRAPGVNNLDFSVFKNFRLGERFTLQFHAEAFNIFNRVQFGVPNQTLGSLSFGEITTQANTPRELQFALKLLF
jgi:hypothetical protein